jgi:hypothetical protein
VTVRQKAWVLVFLRPIIWMGSLLYFMATRDLIGTILLLAITLAAIFCTYFLRCHVCGQHIYKRKVQICGMELSFWGGLPPDRCANCDSTL